MRFLKAGCLHMRGWERRGWVDWVGFGLGLSWGGLDVCHVGCREEE